MRWDAFERACPRIADVARERFVRDELVLVGTLRPDGSPRISPCEVDVAAGRLFLGMMWRSRKATDLQRDPRVAVHSVPSDRMNPAGDVKLYGHVLDEQDPEVRRAFRDAIRRRIDWAPKEPRYHLFSLEVSSAAYLRFADGGGDAWAWDEADGFRELADPFANVE